MVQHAAEGERLRKWLPLQTRSPIRRPEPASGETLKRTASAPVVKREMSARGHNQERLLLPRTKSINVR